MSLMDVGVLDLIDGEQSITDHMTALPTPGPHPRPHQRASDVVRRVRRDSGRRRAYPRPSASHRLESETRHEPQTFKAAPCSTV